VKHPALIALIWLATVALAWFVGANTRPGSSHRQRRQDGTTTARHKDDPDTAGTSRAPEEHLAPDRKTKTNPSRRPKPAAAPEQEPYTLEGVENIDDLSQRFMKFANAQVKKGPEGYKTLFREFDKITQDKELRRFFRDERRMVKAAYPWIKWMVNNEAHMVAMTETLYRTAANDPGWFEGLDDDSLEAITEGLAMMLPGVVDEPTLQRFRDYVTKVLEMDRASLPKALQKNLGEMTRNLKQWAPQLSSEAALARIRDPQVPLNERLALMRHLPREQLAQLDLVAILQPALAAGHGTAISVMTGAPLSGGDIAALDGTFIEAIATGKFNTYSATSYLHATNRRTWSTARGIIEDGLRHGGKATEAFAMALNWGLSERPDSAYVKQVLESYREQLSKNTVRQLKQRYKIE